jgi:8-oxo-dGTP pyrophosphatase MutT (NUDIX family)
MCSNFLDKLRRNLSNEESQLKGASASVAVILDSKMRVIMIRRANKENDPWSNQIAFPGGKRERDDRRYVDTAIRETREELGIDLSKDSEFLGYLGIFSTHTGKMLVVPSVFYSNNRLEPRPNGEVSGFYWIELSSLGSNKTNYAFYREGKLVMNDAFNFEDCIIWGLSYRILIKLLSILGSRLKAMPS